MLPIDDVVIYHLLIAQYTRKIFNSIKKRLEICNFFLLLNSPQVVSNGLIIEYAQNTSSRNLLSENPHLNIGMSKLLF